MNKSPAINILESVLRKVGKFLKRDFFELEHLQSSAQANNIFVNKAFERTRQMLCEEFIKLKPDYSIAVSDAYDAYEGSANLCFIIEPIDGMVNFARAQPEFALTAAIKVKISGVICAACIYMPILEVVYFAEKGQASWYEGNIERFSKASRSRVSQRKSNIFAVIEHINIPQIQDIADNFKIINCYAYSAAMVACGKLDFAALSKGSVASRAVAALLVQEAGGFIITNQQKDHIINDDTVIIYSNANLLNRFEKIFQPR